MPDNKSPMSSVTADMTRSRMDLIKENAFLRQQMIILSRQPKRPTLSWRDRVILVLLANKLRAWKASLLIVQPDTLLRWHREMFRLVWKRKSKAKNKADQPPTSRTIVALIQQMYLDNIGWGAERISGELLKLGIKVGPTTVLKYIRLAPAPRTPKQSWTTFLRNHAHQIWACDFLQTYDALFRALFVFVIIELKSRRVVHFAVTRNPSDPWVAQQLRNATPFGGAPRFLIRDNDCKYGTSFAQVAKGTHIEVLRTPIGAPKANAICERFLGSLRRECLDYFLILSERHLHRIVKEYVAYFNHARPHQGINQRIPCQPESLPKTGRIVSYPVLGGLHHDYRRKAA
jgi:transposase InsO family protein